MGDVLTGTAVVAAVLGGAVALFAPCCISVMLPAYFATSFRRRSALVAMTFVFAAGVAAVILPIAFGATAVTRLIVDYHTPLFLVAGILMIALGVATVLGRAPSLPMPGVRARPQRGPAAVFGLGAFSGVASACCAPVLAGVVALSGAAGSFLAALAVGVAYVFGMVAPLFVIALLWDRRDWGRGFLLGGRSVTLRMFGNGRAVPITVLISGFLLVAMGVVVTALAFSGTAMAPDGWLARLGARLQHHASVAVSWVDWIPGWVILGALIAALAALAARAIRQHLDASEPAATADDLVAELSAPRRQP
jgi:cytochrome c-type biogenesis protein